MKFRRVGIVLLMVAILVQSSAGHSSQATSQPSASPLAQATPVESAALAFERDDDVHGASLGAWTARYWQWITSFPVGVNPAHDPTGRMCGYGQNGPVFFIPSNMPSCTVPQGAAIFLPIAGIECSTVELPPFHGENEERLRACAAGHADRYTRILVRVNGVIVPNIERYRTQSPVFLFQLPANNILATPAGPVKAVGDGYQIILLPLVLGTHEIVVHVEVKEGYALPDKTLHLTVVDVPKGD